MEGLVGGAELITGNSDCHGQIGPGEIPFFDAVWLSLALDGDCTADTGAVLVGAMKGTMWPVEVGGFEWCWLLLSAWAD